LPVQERAVFEEIRRSKQETVKPLMFSAVVFSIYPVIMMTV
jgi:hypothetical protein